MMGGAARHVRPLSLAIGVAEGLPSSQPPRQVKSPDSSERHECRAGSPHESRCGEGPCAMRKRSRLVGHVILLLWGNTRGEFDASRIQFVDVVIGVDHFFRAPVEPEKRA